MAAAAVAADSAAEATLREVVCNNYWESVQAVGSYREELMRLLSLRTPLYYLASRPVLDSWAQRYIAPLRGWSATSVPTHINLTPTPDTAEVAKLDCPVSVARRENQQAAQAVLGGIAASKGASSSSASAAGSASSDKSSSSSSAAAAAATGGSDVPPAYGSAGFDEDQVVLPPLPGHVDIRYVRSVNFAVVQHVTAALSELTAAGDEYLGLLETLLEPHRRPTDFWLLDEMIMSCVVRWMEPILVAGRERDLMLNSSMRMAPAVAKVQATNPIFKQVPK